MPHTPGEWKLAIEGTGTGRGPVIYVNDRDDEIDVRELAELETSEVRDGPSRGKYRWKRKPDADEIEVNAHLMAAAPLLLEAARSALVALRRPDTVIYEPVKVEAERMLERAINAAVDDHVIPLSANQRRIAQHDRQFRTLKRRAKSATGKGR